MLKIRLKRFGAKKNPVYRIVVMESKSRRDGRTVDEIGFYDPHKAETEAGFKLDVDAAKKWLQNGAQPTDTTKDLLKKAKVYG